MIRLIIIVVLSVLTPLAYASPPDLTYVPGIWDDADYDDVVILATSSSAATDSHIQSAVTGRLVVIAQVFQGEDGLVAVAMPAPPPSRAPPAA